MSSKLFKHKQTGKLYSLIQKNIKVKCKTIALEGNESLSCWEDGFVLFKAEYDNHSGPYFVCYAKDFYENFEEAKSASTVVILDSEGEELGRFGNFRTKEQLLEEFKKYNVYKR